MPMYTAEGYAYFVQNPRRIDDLFQPHLPEKEMPYVVAASVALSNLDYEKHTPKGCFFITARFSPSNWYIF